jgi:hypothetical protein
MTVDREYVNKVKSFIQFPQKYTVFIPELYAKNDIFEIVDQNAELYGCIPDHDTYYEMKNMLTKAALGTYHELKIQPLNYRFSMVYIERDIPSFVLEFASKRLVSGGLLVYKTDPYCIFSNAAALSTYYGKINVYKINKYEIVILGEKKKNYAETKKETERLKNMYYNESIIPELIFSPEPVYTVPPADSPKQFVGRPDVKEIEEYIAKSNLYEKVKEQTKISSLKNPIMPLHLSHLGLLLTTGFLDGELNGHIVKGTVVKTKTRDVEDKKEKGKIIREREQIKVVIKILTKEGEIIEI